MRKHLLYLAALLLSCNIAMADNWMTSLPDNVYITQLSIPGTHDAGTGNGFSSLAALFGPTTAQTQDVTISSQWDSGIRAFDFRPAVSNGTLQIYHGIMQTKLTFSNALSIITKKLDENPGEFAVVIMRHEDDADKGDAAWSEMMSTLLKSEFSKYLVNYSPILTLGKVRGKILLISRDKYADKPMGAFASGWSHSDNVEDMKCGTLTGPSRTGKFYVQDYYDMTEAGAIDIKKNSIKALLDCSTHINETTTENIWIINHTSGYTQEASSGQYRRGNEQQHQHRGLAQRLRAAQRYRRHRGRQHRHKPARHRGGQRHHKALLHKRTAAGIGRERDDTARERTLHREDCRNGEEGDALNSTLKTLRHHRIHKSATVDGLCIDSTKPFY